MQRTPIRGAEDSVVVDGKDTICVLPGEYGRSLSAWLPPYVCV